MATRHDFKNSEFSSAVQKGTVKKALFPILFGWPERPQPVGCPFGEKRRNEHKTLKVLRKSPGKTFFSFQNGVY